MLKQTIVAVSGPDMCGKTEISKALSLELGIPRFKATSEHDTYLNHQERFLQQLHIADTRMVDFIKQTKCSVIFDRAWGCEYAYSNVFKRETDMTCLAGVDAAYAKMGARVVVCRRSSYKGIVDDIDPTTQEERLQKLDNAYVDFSHWSKCKTLMLNVDDEDLKREIKEIVEWLRTE